MKQAKKMAITSWALEDRPHFKIIHGEANSLSSAELLAIVLNSGSSKESALDLAKRILGDDDQALKQLAQLEYPQLIAYKGIGPIKAANILAVFELARRMRGHRPQQKMVIRSSAEAFSVFQSYLGGLNHEEFWVAYLNIRNQILGKKRLSKGGFTGTVVDCRELLKGALDYRATSILIAHNHPSGILLPSPSDKELTDRINKAANLMDIRLLDHLIIGDDDYYSFSDEGLMA